MLLLTGLAGQRQASAQIVAPDFDLPGGNGHFYTQANGDAGSAYGYRITNDNGINMWSEFQRLGGVAVLGYPASRRFTLDGFTVQATQKFLLQWRPDANPPQVYFVNVFDKLHDNGQDAALQAQFQIPPQLPASFDAGKTSFNDIAAGRLALLASDPAISARYYNGTNPAAAILYNGLPTSQITNAGPFQIIRDQRDVIQRWTVDSPASGVHAGDVTVVNGGDIAKKLGLVPVEATWTETSTGIVNSPTPAATPTPLASPTPTATPKPSYPYVSKEVNVAPTDCGSNNRVDCNPTDPNAGVEFIQGHVMDPSGNGLGGVQLQYSIYDYSAKITTESDGLFTVTIGTSCRSGVYPVSVWVVDGSGNRISDVHTITYSNCNVAGVFHFDFVRTS